MPDPKSGQAGTLVNPASPRSALLADDADPGKVEKAKAAQMETGTGKYGSTPIKPFKPDANPPPDKPTTWIEVQLVDEAGAPVPGEEYAITLPDGTVASGTLDENGLARVEGLQPGNCNISFPNLDTSAWDKA